MAKPSILTLHRPKAFEETRTFEDLAYPGISLTITIRTRREASELNTMLSLGDELFNQHAPFNSEGEPNIPLQWDGEDISITKPLCQEIATIMTVEASEEKFSFEEWAVISAGMRDTFLEIFAWVSNVVGRKSAPVQDAEGNAIVPNDLAVSTAI